MIMSRVHLFALIAVMGVAGACGQSSSSPKDADVTTDFVSKAGNQTYSVGKKKVDSGASEVVISSDGTMKTKYNDPKCPYVVTGALSKVTKDSDGQHYEFNYSQTDAQLLPDGADSKDCQKMISDYRFNNIPQKVTKIACGYTAEYVDFACTGDKNHSANWILKN